MAKTVIISYRINRKKEEFDLADQRKAALDVAIRKIEKNFGKGSIMRMGDATDMKVASVSSGSLAIDKALGLVDILVVG